MGDCISVYVVGFVFDENRNVLLIEKKRPKWQAGRWNGIGGHVEPGESAVDAIRRECREEAGLLVSDWDEVVTLLHRDWVVKFFKAKLPEGQEIRQVTDERLGWVADHALGRFPVLDNLRWLVPLCLDTVKLPLVLEDIGYYIGG